MRRGLGLREDKLGWRRAWGIHFQVRVPDSTKWGGFWKAERTRVPLTTKHRGILSYVLDGVRWCLDICSIILSRSRWCWTQLRTYRCTEFHSMTSNDIQRRCRDVGNTPRRTFHRGKIFVILKKGVGDLVWSAVTIHNTEQDTLHFFQQQ